MAELRRGETASESEGGRDPDGEVAAAVDAYLQLANGDVKLALAVSVADGIAVSKLVSTGYARWRQPKSRGRGWS
jgi:hypothetical protein